MAHIVNWKLEDFTPETNPFKEDYVSVGLCLDQLDPKLKDWYVMYNGWNQYDFYIVHKATGKRMGITLEQ